ncbi:Cellular morphogenesis protein [Geosmithia morbida]|uniref:Cellular morphogenesis protein n=1 Tax=Geosmithia morbida TaxID=1094350 RepID=A0A9P4YYS8_9HYPO|nr:Cellular morphogenesis protein [Geosmithia morbida]KAF4123494.1 Cellular morphogenesis protein [Geosmithia morbida]
MRISQRQRHRAPRLEQKLGAAIGLIASFVPAVAHALDFRPAPDANLDFSNLGRIGIAGDFTGISLYEYEGQTGRPPSSNGSESLLAMLPNGALTSIVSTDASIEAMCTFKSSDGDVKGVVIGGNFTSLDGTQSTSIALYDPNTGKVTPVDGLEGQVDALYCDDERETVYVGGNFKTADSSNAIAYDTEGLKKLPFAGFNGPVEAITKAANGHIIFGGSFTGLGNASAPSEPDGQTVNLSTANITAENSSGDDGFGNPASLVCSSESNGTTWLAQDGVPAAWDADFGFGFQPTKLRLRNTHQDGRGTKTFRFVAFPINGIMNLTYIDPASGTNKTCTSECPLSHDADIQYQDFHFVNKVGMDHFRIAISEWYGDGAGLDGVELFQDDIFAYAVSDFNEPACRSVSNPSSASRTGPWEVSPSLQSSSGYLTLDLGSSGASRSSSVVFKPNIRESGNYTVNMYTPGCQPDGTCERRGRVNVTGTMSSADDGDDSFVETIYQTNDFDKYDQIYFGYIEKTSDAFQPSVTLSPMDDDDGSIVVALRVGFILMNSTGGLNGLYDFDPSQSELDTSSLETSPVNKLGASFDDDTGVKTLLTSDKVTYVGGNFTSKSHENIVAIDDDGKVSRLDGGLDGEVTGMLLVDGKLYVGGGFGNTQTEAVDGMDHVAVYDVEGDSWGALGAGVDGPVQYVVPLQVNLTGGGPETAVAFTGSFTRINGFDGGDAVPVDGLAIWIPSEENWLQNLDGPVPSYSGTLTATLTDLGDGEMLYAGSVTSAQMGANGAATLHDDGLGQFPADLRAESPTSELGRRDVSIRGGISGVVTGLFNNDDGRNVTILAGHFSARSSNGSAIDNLIIIDGEDGDKVYGLGGDISADSTFAALDIGGSTLYAGGSVSGNGSDLEVGGIIAYDLGSHRLGTQPSSVSGGNATVSAISVRPGRESEVYVGGDFTKAGALDCPGFCLYSADTSRWVRPGSGVGGDVRALMWTSRKTLLVAGDLERGSGRTSLAVYEADDESWEEFPGADALPGPVYAVTPGSTDNDQIWVAGESRTDGSPFLMKYDGSSWHTANHSLGSGSVLRSLQVLTVTKDHGDSAVLGRDQVLMLTGSLNLADFGMASAAIYNGTGLQPYAMTTSSTSKPGSIAKIFSERNYFFSSTDDHMALGFVVLIGLGISLALILLMVAAGIALDRIRKKREGYIPAPTSMYDRGSGMKRIPPNELFGSLAQGRSPAPRV